MRFEAFVAMRYLLAKRKQTFITVISIISIVGVAIGVAALIIVLGVYNGFTTDIREKILGANAHVIITGSFPELQNSPQDISPDGVTPALQQLITNITQVPDVLAATPFVYAEGMISSSRGVKGLILRGIDPQTAPKAISMLSQLTAGSVDNLTQKSGQLPGVIIGAELAKRLALNIGSRVNLLSPAGQRSAAGFQPRIRPYVVAGIFRTGMFEYDSSLAFVSLSAARNLLGLPPTYISGIEVTVDNVYEADTIGKAIHAKLGAQVFVRHWMEMNANLFAALQLERIGMFILLAMVMLVGSFSIVTTLVMLVMEKTRDIAILMSMGATKAMIRNIFMLQGTIIGFIGTALGTTSGIIISLVLQRTELIKLPPGVYTINYLPVLLQSSDIILVAISAMFICFFATIYPARKAASLEPADALRYD